MTPLVVGESSLCSSLVTSLASARLRAVRFASLRELFAKPAKGIVFVESAALASSPEAARLGELGPVIVLTNEGLHATIELFAFPWFGHVINAAMLQHPLAVSHLENLVQALASSKHPRLLSWAGKTMHGRRVRLTHSNARVDRLEKMSDYFTEQGVGPRTLHQLRDAAEELLTNAFYDAPVSAGVLSTPVPRTQDLSLPDDEACDLAYGCRDDIAFVRIRDPFGSLSRQRLVQVLTRCAQPDVQVDESMGGAGLGMWRLFSISTILGISVVAGERTEVFLGIAKRSTPGSKPSCFHLFFRDGVKRRFWRLRDDETNSVSVNRSVMIGKL